MNYNREALTYILLVIPVVFAFTVTAQGLQKMSRDEPEGKVAVGFGIFFLILTAAAYVMFIR
jgi:hypothetical protein